MDGRDLAFPINNIEESPWGDIKGKPIDSRFLAEILSQYDVKSDQVKHDGQNKRGYFRRDLHDAWTRYLPPAFLGSATSTTSATDQLSVNQAHDLNGHHEVQEEVVEEMEL